MLARSKSPGPPLAVVTLALLGALLGACGRTGSPTTPTTVANPDVAGATLGVTDSPELLGDDLFDVTGSTLAVARRAGPFAAIQPHSFYRWVRTATREFTFAFSDSDSTARPRVADVTVRRDLEGMVHVIQRPPGEGAPDTHAVVHKFMHDAWVRHLRLARETVATEGGSEWRWRVTAASGVRIASLPGSRSIATVHLAGAGLDVTIPDPARLLTLAELPRVAAGDSVTVTVTTGAPDDVVLLYWHDHRERMAPAGGNTYTLRFAVGDGAGLRGLGVNALSHGTLYDDVSAYDSIGWITPVWVGDGTPSVWP